MIPSTEDAFVCGELSKAGLRVNSVYDLVNTKRKLGESVIETLVRILPVVIHPSVKEGVVRALTTREARNQVEDVLLKEFLAIQSDDNGKQNLKWVIGNALSVVAGKDHCRQLLDIARDAGHGKSREMIVLGLGRMKGCHEANSVLIELLKDKNVAGHAAKAVCALNCTDALPELNRLQGSYSGWIAKEFKKAVEKLSAAE
ncbi:MAG: hypothetical protein AB1457_18470 [Chloroflexota bacterium]